MPSPSKCEESYLNDLGNLEKTYEPDPKGPDNRGGERGIRTLDTGLSPYNALAGRPLRPLGHLSGEAKLYLTGGAASYRA